MKKWKKYFTGVIKELKSRRSSWKIKIKIGTFLQCDTDDIKFEKEMFIDSTYGTITLEINPIALADDNIRWIGKKCVDLDKRLEGSWFSFNFVSSLSIRCDKAN